MITAIVGFVGGVFFQKFVPFLGDTVVSKVQAGWNAVAGMFGPKK